MPPRSCSVPELVGYGSPRDGRESPAQLLELALLRAELGPGFCVPPALPQLEHECLDPANEPGELRASARRLGRAEGASYEHKILLSPVLGGATRTRATPPAA
jgi:hypothetical protein